MPEQILRMIVIALGLAGTGAASACEDPQNVPEQAPEELQELSADRVIYDLRHNVTLQGVREALLEADTAYFYDDSAQVRLEGLRLNVFEVETGRERALVTARSGTLNPQTQEMTARGDVVLTVPEQGRRIESPELKYDPRRDRIWSDSATVMTMQGRTTRGSAFESDLEFRNVTLYSATGRLRGDGS